MSSPDALGRAQARIIAAILALIVSVTLTSLHAQTREPLFSEGPDSSALAGPASADSRPFFVRSRTANLNASVLDRAMSSPAASEFTLNLFDDAVFALAVERIETSASGHRTWAGHIVDRPLSTVTLTQKDDIVTGLITDGTTAYAVVALGGGVHRIDQLDTTKMPPERDVVVRPDAVDDAAAPSAPAMSSPAAVSTVDIFVYYSSVARAQLGGTSQAQSRAAQYVANANLAYQRSGVNGQLQLVGTAEIAAPDPAAPETLLNQLSSSGEVLNQREASHADLVALLVNEMSSEPEFFTCGIGHIGPGSSAAFSVTSINSACVYTFVHETGHNLGGQHAPGDFVLEPPTHPESEYPLYARGYKFQGGSPFRTVMAYECSSGPSCPRILNFSEPAVLQAGQPTGSAAQHNARRLNEIFPIAAAYRAGGPPPLAPSAPQNLQAITNGFNVTLQWQAPASGTPTNFVVAAGTGPGLTNIGVVPVGLTLSVSAALPAGAYFARVYAQNATGSSPASNEVSFTLGATSPPGPPLNLTSNVVGGTLSLAWQPPSSGGAPSAYLIDAGTASGLSNLVAGFPIAGTALTVPGAPTGRFFIRVRSRNAIGTSAPSNEVDVTIGPSCTLPSAPQNFTVTKNGVIVTVSWSAPAVGTPSTYIVQAGSSSGAANLFNGSVGLTTSLSAQAPPGAYFLRALAANACGTGPATGEIAITVP